MSDWNPQWKARPTIYRGIQMRSRLEATWAALFDTKTPRKMLPFVQSWDYEPLCFGGPSGQYLPDFRLRCNYPHPWTCYAEVKPIDPSNPQSLMERMEIILLSEPDAYLWLIVGTPLNHGGWDTVRREGRHFWVSAHTREVPVREVRGNDG